MDKFQRFWRDILNRLKKLWPKKRSNRIILTIIMAIVSLIIYLVISFFSVSKTELALAELKQSFAPGIICHEKCALFRQVRERIIISELSSGKKSPGRVLVKVWEEEKSPEFKRALVRILFLTYGEHKAPLYIRDYLLKDDADLSVIREIVFRFPSLALNNLEFKHNLASRLSATTSLEEKLEFMKILREIANDAEIDNYFSVLLEDGELEFRLEAIKNISDIKDKLNYFTLEQLEIIKILALQELSDKKLRRNLVFLIGDYYLVFPEAAANAWLEIYQQTELDSISRLLAIDSLNHLEKTTWPLPEVSPLEWSEYYNN
jgi:hypothetical protein